MIQLLYVTDPMCSWCFGFAPVIAKVKAQLADGVGFRLVLGGLAPDSDEPMEANMLAYVQQAWRAVTARTGVEFNHEFWEQHHPKRSTWPACRAVLAAGERGELMFEAIQRAYYVDARDPSDKATLIAIAGQLGLDRQAFEQALDSAETKQLLAEEFKLRDQIGANSFPSLGLQRDGEFELLASGWNDEASLFALLRAEHGTESGNLPPPNGETVPGQNLLLKCKGDEPIGPSPL
ncbi:MAG: putative protein-disulfide isomerase, partial [Planctomycetota bacterium]